MSSWETRWREKKYKEQFQAKHVLAASIFSKLNSEETIKSAVDIGCGSCVLLKELQSEYGSIQFSALDNNRYTEELVTQLGMNYIECDLCDKSLEEEYDVGILTDVLEHFESPQEILNRLVKCKYLIIVVPNFSFITERLSVLLGKTPFQMKPSRGGHKFWMNDKSFLKIINESDFKLQQRYYSYPDKASVFPLMKWFKNLFCMSFGALLVRND